MNIYDNKYFMEEQIRQTINMYKRGDMEFDVNTIEKMKSIKKQPGLYLFWHYEELLYVGKSKDIQIRTFHSFKERLSKKKLITHYSYHYVKNRCDLDLLEILLITENEPLFNKEFKSGAKSKLFKSNININKLKKIKVIK